MKSIFKSKTFWFGALQIVAAYGGYVGAIFPPAAAASGVAAGIATIILRVLTTQPVSVPGVTPAVPPVAPPVQGV